MTGAIGPAGGPTPTPAPITPMSDADFSALGQMVHELTGIVVTERKRWMLTSRLSRELRRLGLTDFTSYRKLLAGPGGAAELVALTSAVTTNVTAFFRGPDHFEALAAMIPDLRRATQQGRRIRIWSSACSTGEEPYSIAMTLMEHWPDIARTDIRILATDIDPTVIEHARKGIYDIPQSPAENSSLLNRHTVSGPQPGTIAVLPELRKLIRFETLNLLESWPFKGQFDIIFCRNVVIYFDAETRSRLWQRLAGRLLPDGWLFVGHSERIDQSLSPWLRPAGVTRYRRTATPFPDQTMPAAPALRAAGS